MPETITDQLAGRAGDDVLIVADDVALTAGECRRRAAALGADLLELGVRPGDRVAVLQPLSADALLLWWAIDRIGAVYLPLNPVWTSRLAGRVLRDRAPRLLIADTSLRALADASAGTVAVHPPPVGASGSAAPAVARDPSADCAIVHNSGLPGIHHGVRATPRSLATMGTAMGASHPQARVLVGGNTCFMGVLVGVYGAVATGGSVALAGDLDADSFWPTVRRTGVTYAALLNPTLAELLARPASPDDLDHELRLVVTDPSRAELTRAAAERFGVHWISGMAKTEVCGAVETDLDPAPEDGLGRVRPPFIGRIVDQAGTEVDTGRPGELQLRCSVDGGLTPGYADDPDATAALWRDGWMRTGWHVRRDGHSNLHPVGTMSVDPIVIKRAGYLFTADLEAEIVAVGAGVTGARVATRPGDKDHDDPVVVAWLTGDVQRSVLVASLTAGLPAHLVPDVLVPVERLPESPDAHDVPRDAWR